MTAADLLVRAYGGERLDTLPDAVRPMTREEAYAIQDAVRARLGPVGGWKVGAKAPAQEPACAPILARLLHGAPGDLPGSAFAVRVVEGEVAFRIGRDLPPRPTPYSRAEVLDAVDAALPGIEVVDGRFRDRTRLDPLTVLADNLGCGAYVAGADAVGWRGLDLSTLPVRLLVDGVERVTATGGNPAGDPLRLLVWLANAHARTGGLARGAVVTTGSCTGMVPVGPAATVRVEFAGLGAVEARFTG